LDVDFVVRGSKEFVAEIISDKVGGYWEYLFNVIVEVDP